MGRGHVKNPQIKSCITCEKDFLALHYMSKYCSKSCMHKNQYARNRKKEKDKGYRLWKDYRITLDEYESRAKQQNYACAICERKVDILYVDHCHTNKNVRGLLCMNCNTALGHFQDNTRWLIRAVNYLEQNEDELKKVRGN